MFKNIALLAAGESKRFWPLTNKSLFVFNGKPLLIHQLDAVSDFVETIYVVVRESSHEATKKVLQDFKKESVRLLVQTGTEQLNAIYALKNAIHDEVVIMNCSGVFDTELILQEYLKKKEANQILLAAKEMATYYPGGYIKFVDNKVSAIVEKPDPNNLPSKYARFVCDYIADFPHFIEEIEKVADRNQDGAYEAVLNTCIAHAKTDMVPYTGQRYTLKYPWNVLEMTGYFLGQVKNFRGEGCEISPHAEIEGPVHIGNNVKIMSFSRIVGPCYIGDNSIIGNYTMVRDSMLGNNVRTGSFSEISRSYLGYNVNIHRSFVGDSVLGIGVRMGAGGITANRRFDATLPKRVQTEIVQYTGYKIGAIVGENTHIGVRVSTMPGVKIAPNSHVLPGAVVSRDITD